MAKCAEIRVSKTARYVSNFTPSTEPFVSDANTDFLYHAEGDTTSQRVLYNSGNVSVKAGKTGFGSSFYFNGASSMYVSDSNLDIALNQDFTLDYWLRMDAKGTIHYMGAYGAGGNFLISYYGNQLTFFDNAYHFSGVDPVIGQWYHLAWTRAGNLNRMFVDGVQKTSWTNGMAFDTTNFHIGRNLGYTGLTGYIDEFRIQK